ncbi:hypothetical protein AB0I16_33355 [Streptomyces sp. NPDC050703]|uniref:hypothetical protein n=1 Tax=Streptomyces sp. NPDC050703 TaxID=3157218 RepID=UPI00342C7175
MTDMADNRVRTLLRAHQDGGAISRLYETGRIDEETFPALDLLISKVEDGGNTPEAERLTAVLAYTMTIGERPDVPNWVNRTDV